MFTAQYKPACSSHVTICTILIGDVDHSSDLDGKAPALNPDNRQTLIIRASYCTARSAKASSRAPRSYEVLILHRTLKFKLRGTD